MSLYAKYEDLGEKPKATNLPPCMWVQDMNHRHKLLKENMVVCIDLYGDWCEPCKMIEADYEKLAQKYNKDRFKRDFEAFVLDKWEKHAGTTRSTHDNTRS